MKKIFLAALALVALARTGVETPEEEPGDDPGNEVVPVAPVPLTILPPQSAMATWLLPSGS